MRKLKGYTHYDFFNEENPFYASTFFILLNLIKKEYDENNKSNKK
jgi:hypothetical protein